MKCPSNSLTPYGSAAKDLLTKFCECSTARDLLAQKMGTLVQPIFLSVDNYPMAKTDFAYTDTTLTKLDLVMIKIPLEEPRGKALSHLTWEILNCMRGKFQKLDDQAKSGDLSLDQYALQKEIAELESGKLHDSLIKQCEKPWKIKNPEQYFMQDPEETDVEVTAWTEDFMGHTDAHRSTWIETFRAPYCKKHPEDKKSCSVTKKDLVDWEAYNSLPLKERGKIMAQRICKRFTEAPKKVQELMRDIAQSNCPSVLSSSKSDL